MSAENSPNISARWECIFVMIPKSRLRPSIKIFPLLFVNSQAPPDFVAALLLSEAMNISLLSWINAISDSSVFSSLALWIRSRLHTGRLFIYHLSDIEIVEGTLSTSSWMITLEIIISFLCWCDALWDYCSFDLWINVALEGMVRYFFGEVLYYYIIFVVK